MSRTQIVAERLAPLRDMLNADGYDLVVRDGAEGLVAEITAGAEACEDCLVPEHIMRRYVDSMLEPEFGADLPHVAIVYPAAGTSPAPGDGRRGPDVPAHPAR